MTAKEIFNKLVELNKDYCNLWVNPRLVASTSNPDYFSIHFDRFSGIYICASIPCVLYGVYIKEGKVVANFELTK